MRKPKAYTWLNPEMKRALKMIAIEKDKKLLDLRPLDIGMERKEEERRPYRFRI